MLDIDQLIVAEDETVIGALQKLEATGRRILFVAPDGLLRGVLTDSDVRKFLLRGGSLSDTVDGAANYTPKSLPLARRSEAKATLHRYNIDALPLLDAEGRLADVVFAADVGEVKPRRRVELPVVIMAGGLGTRLYPYTRILPKPLIPIGERPILEIIIDRFCDAGCRDFTLIVNHKRNMIKSYFADAGKDCALHYVDEEVPLGTGGGLSLLKGQLNEPFFLTNCDVLIDADYADIAAYHKDRGNDITMVCAAKDFAVPYGVVEMTEGGEVKSMSEKPSFHMLVNVGMYMVEPGVVQNIPEGQKLGFTDIIESCRTAGGRVGVYPIGDGSWADMGQIEELEAMRRRIENA